MFHKHVWIYIGQNKIISGEQLFKCKKCGMYLSFNKYLSLGYKTKRIDIQNYILQVNIKNYFGVDTCKKATDGYHSFDELYHHRMMLFSVICNTYKQYAWKSKLHEDGTMYEDMFIVGVTIPNVGDYSYHYHTKDWDKFNVKELEKATKWDGHQPKDIDRLMYLVELNEVLG